MNVKNEIGMKMKISTIAVSEKAERLVIANSIGNSENRLVVQGPKNLTAERHIQPSTKEFIMKTKCFLPLAFFAVVLTFSACSGGGGSDDPVATPSSNSGTLLCAGEGYDPDIFRCEAGELIGKCAGQDYYPAYQQCNNGVVENRDESSSSQNTLSSSSEVSSSSSSRHCNGNDLGKGYDVVGSPYINWTEVNNIAVLDQDKMCQDGILELDKPGSAQQYASFSGSTIKEFYSKRNESMKISANLGVDIDIAFIFSAKLDAKFASKTSSGSSQNSSLKYYYAQIRSYLYTGEDQIKSNSASAQNLSKYLRADFVSDIKSTMSAGQILDKYGSHIFIHYYKGGSLEANYTYLGSESSSRFTSASEMELAVKGSFAKKVDVGIGTSSGVNIEQGISELENHMSFNYETYGGNALGATNTTGIISGYSDWVTSVRGDKARTTGIKDFAQSFIPIWDLAQQVEGVSSARINTLKDEFKRRAEAQGAKFPMEEDIPCTPADNSETHYCSNGFLREYGRVTHNMQTYKTVTIGTQTWFAENIRGVYFNSFNWASAMNLPSSCNTTNTGCSIQSKHQGICPSGWHIPSFAEWNSLISFVRSDSKCSNCAGTKLKSRDGWRQYNGFDPFGEILNYDWNGTDDYGFTALPSNLDDDSQSIWWTSNVNGTSISYNVYISGDAEIDVGWLERTNDYSVRCIMD